MIGDKAPGATSVVTMIAEPHRFPCEHDVWRQAGSGRLLLVPAVTVMLYVGGVYWIRSQVTDETDSRGRETALRVQLLPHPAPSSIAATPAAALSAAPPRRDADAPANDHDQAATDMAALTSAQISAPSDPQPFAAPPMPLSAAPPPAGITASFQQTLLRHVGRFQRFPRAARRERLHGAVDTLFSMRRDGSLLGVWVKTSSGQPVLDREAIDAIRRAQPLPAIPPELPDSLNIRLTLLFDPS